jgi:hypothetical protein
VARAEIDIPFLEKIDIAPRVGANRIERLDLITGATQIDGTDGDLREFVPGIDPIGKDWEFAGNAVIGKRFKAGDTHCGAGGSLAAQRIQKDLQSSE